MPLCTVIVAHKSGLPARGVRVSGAVSAGGMAKAVNTDTGGRALLEWSSNASLSDIYISGKGHRGPFKNGGTYTFQI